MATTDTPTPAVTAQPASDNGEGSDDGDPAATGALPPSANGQDSNPQGAQDSNPQGTGPNTGTSGTLPLPGDGGMVGADAGTVQPGPPPQPTPSLDFELRCAFFAANAITVLGPSLKPGTTFAFNARVINDGSTRIAPQETLTIQQGVYLSGDASWSSDDQRLATVLQTGSWTQPDPGALIGPNTAMVPAFAVPGPYYLIVRVDELNQVTEPNENNNTCSEPLTVTAN